MIDSTKVWTYQMVGVVPPGVPEGTIEAVIRAAVSWNDTLLPYLRGGAVKVDEITPDDLVRRTGQTGLIVPRT